MQVIATTRAWHAGQRIWPGQCVTLPDGCDMPAWARPVELEEPTAPPVKRRRRRKPAPKTEQQTDSTS